jgi:diaminopimelate epimerase
MGEPRFSWRDIPLASDEDTLHLPIGMGSLKNPAAVSMGNPHMIFFVSNAGVVALEELGPKLEHHPLFPERANVNVAQVDAKDKITLRVWERGAGITLACGTGACATLVAAHRRGFTDRKATVTLPGGTLIIEWADNNHVLMTGPVVTSFEGKLD